MEHHFNHANVFSNTFIALIIMIIDIFSIFVRYHTHTRHIVQCMYYTCKLTHMRDYYAILTIWAMLIAHFSDFEALKHEE